MSAFLAVLLVVPLLVAVGVVVRRDRAVAAARIGGGTVALGWAVVAVMTAPEHTSVLLGPGTPVTLGRLGVDTLTAGAVAGAALLLAAMPPRSPLATSAGCTGITLFAATATVSDTVVPDRRFAIGLVLLTAIAVARLRGERARVTAMAGSALAGLAAVAGLVGSDAETAAALAVAGTAVLVATTLAGAAPVTPLLPAVALVAVRTAAASGASDALVLGSERLAVVGVGVAAAGALVLLALRRRPVAERLPPALVLAGLALVVQDVADVHRAAVLLLAGGVLALAGRHPVALLAAVPALVGLVDAAGTIVEPVAVAAGGAAAAAVAVASLAVRSTPRHAGPLRWPVVPAVAFGLAPTAGWAQVAMADQRAVLLTVAAIGAGAVAVSLVPQVRAITASGERRDAAGRRGLGRIGRRPRTGADPHDGQAILDPDAEPQAGSVRPRDDSSPP